MASFGTSLKIIFHVKYKTNRQNTIDLFELPIILLDKGLTLKLCQTEEINVFLEKINQVKDIIEEITIKIGDETLTFKGL